MTANAFRCRICGNYSPRGDVAPELVPILNLGRTPLANRLLRREELNQPEPTYPLEAVFCSNCSLLQITETVPPEVLFRHYIYRSSYSDAFLEHCQRFAAQLIRGRNLGSGSLVVEAASNDGYLLRYFARGGIRVLGVDPAENLARMAEEKGVTTLCEFFGLELAERLCRERQLADVFLANNVLAHVADLNGFVAGVRRVLKDDGLAVVEVPYVGDIIDRVEFDTIYHEHLCYFSLTALEQLFAHHALRIVDVERIAIHGGSLRVFAQPGASEFDNGGRPNAAVREQLDQEANRRMNRPDDYRNFAESVEQLKHRLCELLAKLKADGMKIAAYGASAKGSTLLNYCGIGKETIDFVVDRSPLKQGLYTPGTHLPIHAPGKLLQAMPDYVLLLTWNFRDEILSQQAEYLRRGGRFIIPIPQPEIVRYSTCESRGSD